MARITNKINLPTNTTDIKMLANYLLEIKSRGIVTPQEEQELFSKVKSLYSRKKKDNHAKDTHTKSALALYGLIDVKEDGSFSISSLGRDVVSCFDSNSTYTIEEKLALMLKVFIRMEIVDVPNGRKIHIGFVLIKMLCDPDLEYYITNQELAHLVMNSAFVSDDQYSEMKEYVLAFRDSEVAISLFAPQTKATTFMTTFVTNWEFLTSDDVSLTQKQNKLADKFFSQYLNDEDVEESIDDADDGDTNVSEEESSDIVDNSSLSASQKNAYRAYHSIIKYRLNGLASYISKIYLSLLDGLEIKDYLSYFNNENKSKNSSSLKYKSLQKITYGAPGTGKSHGINIDTKGQAVIRTTFHPDSDYSTFVGAYKPTMEFVETRVVPVVVDTGLTFDKNNGTYKEKKITYKFVKQAFLKAYLSAWKKYTETKTDDEGKEVILPQFLVIEEINRGNCAQIFGDLFQLLDRQDNKFSSYPIEADADLQQEIANAFKNDPLYKLSNNINVEGIIKDYTSNYADENGNPCTLSDDIQSGRVLLLPKNLYIWATMNTSDQSLFPIDSAFKRRWDWEYVRISEGRDKQNNNEPLRWYIAINEEQYDWWSFLNKINERIGSITSSEDKKLGYFFCKADDGKISAEKFVSKVCFYLWNDVFKDFGFGKKDQSAAFKKENGKDIAFDDFYTEDPETFKSKVNEDLLESFMQKLEVDTVAKRLEKENKAAENNNNAPQQNEVPTE